MLKPKFIKPNEYMNLSYQNKIILEEVDKKIALVKNFINTKTNNQQESNLDVSNFLKDLFYKNNYKIDEEKHLKNSSGALDLTITDIQQDIQRYGVILELKKTDSDDMISKDNFFKKSFYQAVHYYIADKKDYSNTSKVKFIIITNNIKWFFIKTSDLDDAIENKKDNNQKKLDYPNTTKKETPDIYLSLDAFFKDICERITTQTSLFDIKDNHIDVELPFTFFDLQEINYKNNNEDFELFLKFLSDSYLFDKADTVEKNSLDKRFYNELLYIIGLCETKQSSKTIYKQIENNFSFLALTQKAITKKDKKISAEKLYELSIELVLLWINRLIFIQLYSSILVKYKIINKPILNDETTTFDQIEMLFCEVLQGNYETSTFEHIPYINSSLFLQEQCESIVSINQLNNEIKCTPFDKTVLQKEQINENDNILKYLIKFLNSCDVVADDNFATSNTKPLINPSILGKIFEKFNGYKDGSYYTPSYITEYISNTTIEKAIIQKFQDNGFESSDIEKLKKKIYIDDKQLEANKIFDSITICDPAVGSGHFLVSALNAMILYKARLGLFEEIKPSQLEIVDDTLMINNLENYSKSNANKDSKIQAAYEELYYAKQNIISNSLFGVDINPKSVYIARLRLWIELLKHIHYSKESNYERFVLLPNIDINIKQGNSLISNFDLDYKFDTLFEQNIFAKYKTLINDYKNPINDRDEIREKIVEVKNQLDDNFDDKNKFEWRYEFPEVLDVDGRFIGFDVVIGNPPYVRQEAIKEQKEALSKIYKVANGTADLYVYFYELAIKLLKPNGLKGFICSNKFYKANYGEELRGFILENTTILSFSDFGDKKVFEDATVTSDITILKNTKPQWNNIFNVVDIDLINYYEMKQSELNKSGFIFLKPEKLNLKSKIENNGIPLQKWDILIKSGIKTGFNEAFIIDSAKKDELIKQDQKSAEIIKPYLRGRDVEKYGYNFKELFLITVAFGENIDFEEKYPAIYAHLLNYENSLKNRGQCTNRGGKGQHHWLELDNNPTNMYFNNMKDSKIIWIELSDLNKFAFDNNSFYVDMTIFFITGENLKYLLALLNSKLIFWYFNLICAESGVGTNRWKKTYVEQIPIPKIDEEKQQPFIKLVDEILESKQKNPKADTKIYEKQIDKLVYELYGLNEKEIKIIEEAY